MLRLQAQALGSGSGSGPRAPTLDSEKGWIYVEALRQPCKDCGHLTLDSLDRAIGARNVSVARRRGQSGQFLHFWPPIFVRHSGPDVIGLNNSGHDQYIDVCLSVYEVCSQSSTA